MVRTAIAALVIVAACSYDDPDLGNTQFACDPGHECPSGFVCSFDLCVITPGPSSDGVACFTNTCPPSQKCCLYVTEPPTGDCADIAEDCGASYEALCDERTDCTGDEYCCDNFDGPSCGTNCFGTVCLTDADCPQAERYCDRSDATRPWGVCEVPAC